jgi:hypothetical protein
MLPLSSIKGVGARAEDIIIHQPYADCKDLCFRARPNRGMVDALAFSGALYCLPDSHGYELVEDFMEYYDSLVAERSEEDKRIAREAKKKFKPAISLTETFQIDESDVIIERTRANRVRQPIKLRGNIKSLISDDLFD